MPRMPVNRLSRQAGYRTHLTRPGLGQDVSTDFTSDLTGSTFQMQGATTTTPVAAQQQAAASSSPSLLTEITNLLTPAVTAAATAVGAQVKSATTAAAAKPATTAATTTASWSKYLLYGGIGLLGLVVVMKLAKRRK